MKGPELRHAGLNLGQTDALTPTKAETAVFGFWVFLMSDAVIFALLFATYGTMVAATAGGPTPASEYKIGPAFLETLVLLTSSFTFGMASIAMKYGAGQARAARLDGAHPGAGPDVPRPGAARLHHHVRRRSLPTRSGFLSSFFSLVPLHGLHVMAGSLWLIVMMVQVLTLGLDARVKINILRLGLFWHFLDVVWIAIFSVVYLQGLVR